MSYWVYTDGACGNNGRYEPKEAGWGIYWGDNHRENDYGPVFGTAIKDATNNRAELVAVLKALEAAIRMNARFLTIYTDSAYITNAFTKDIYKWKTNGLKTSKKKQVKNLELIKAIDQLTFEFECVCWEHVRGHSNDYGNHMADEMANDGADRSQNYLIFSSGYCHNDLSVLLESYQRIYNFNLNVYGCLTKRRLKNAVYQSRNLARRYVVDKKFLSKMEEGDYSFMEFVIIAEIALRKEYSEAFDNDSLRMFEKTVEGYKVTEEFLDVVQGFVDDEDEYYEVQEYLDKYLSDAGFYQMYAKE